uniref:Uncharacterized protein n=1 Tax=Globodera rostochiensis TaxID=31243 RepID=A0A914H6F0_GLORO
MNNNFLSSSLQPLIFVVPPLLFSMMATETAANNFSLPEEIAGYKGKPFKGEIYYGADDGSCGWWDNTSLKYVPPKLDYQQFNFKCMHEFHWHAYGPACGNPYYEFAKYCAKVKFYQNKSPKNWRNPKNEDMLLVLIDGCLVCEEEARAAANPKERQIEATIRLKHTWKAGSFFTTCDEKNRTAGEVKVKLGNTSADISEMSIDSYTNEEKIKILLDAGDYHYAAFTLSAALYQRKCRGLFSTDPIPDMYQNLTLTVEHNCKGNNNGEVRVHLPDIGPKQFKDNWVEARGLYINILNPADATQYSYVDYKYVDLSEQGGITWFNEIYSLLKSEQSCWLVLVYAVILASRSLRLEICGPKLAARNLRPEACGPKFAAPKLAAQNLQPRSLRPEICGPEACGPKFAGRILRPRILRPEFCARNLRPKICGPEICGPIFAARILRPEACGPKFAAQNLRPDICGPEICGPKFAAPKFAARYLRPRNLRPEICGPNFAARSLRPEICAPKFAARILRPEICGPNFAARNLRPKICGPKLAARNLRPRNLRPEVCGPIFAAPKLAARNLRPRSLRPEFCGPLHYFVIKMQNTARRHHDLGLACSYWFNAETDPEDKEAWRLNRRQRTLSSILFATDVAGPEEISRIRVYILSCEDAVRTYILILNYDITVLYD